ncbi:MAG TPA: O-antigen ligase family protein [Candidatus Binatia bacterium]|nr:O-antigen ligase family protein [Candidatus Binatia bacterium]
MSVSPSRRAPRERVRDLAPYAIAAMFAVLGAALALGRFPLPGGDSFGYASWARNVVIAALVAGLAGAPTLRWPPSPVGTALLVYLAAAALSVAANHGSWADVRGLAVGVGMFLVAERLAAFPSGSRLLVDWLGAVTVAIVLRELVNDPFLVLVRESARTTLVTDHPNTLGYALALLAPIFLAAARSGPARGRAALYAIAAVFGVVVTFSRAAWLAVAVSAIALAVARDESRGRFESRLGAAALGILLAIAVAIAVGQVSLGRGEADHQRLRIIEASLTLFREHWLVGLGFGTKNLEQLFPGRYIELFGESLFLFHSHNFYVDALAGTGLVGAAAAAWLVARLAGLAVRATRAPAAVPAEAVACVATIGTFLGIALVDMPFYHARLTILFAVALALLEHRVEESEGTTATARPIARPRRDPVT